MTTCILGLIMFIEYFSGLCPKGYVCVWIMTTDIKTYITQEQRHKTKIKSFGSVFSVLLLRVGIPHY